MIKSREFDAVGANIRGIPRMKVEHVRADLKTLKNRGDIIVTQEFGLDYYWAQFERVYMKSIERTWASSPNHRRAFGNPIEGAQAVFWKTELFKRIDVNKAPSFDFDISTAGIMNNRWLRAGLLEERESGLRGHFGTTHFVVGGDRGSDSPQRKRLMSSNIEHLDDFLNRLRHTGDPIWFQLDANIARDSSTYPQFKAMLNKHKAKVHGVPGIEYCFTIDSHTDTKMVVRKEYVIRTRKVGGPLFTDHEARGTRMYLVRK